MQRSPYACPSWPPQPASAPRGHVLVIAYGGINQLLSQVSDAIVLGHALRANVIVPELLVHHYWNDSLRLPQLIDVPRWIRSAAAVGVKVVRPDELTGDVAAWYAQCGRKGPMPDPGHTSAACKPYHVALPKGAFSMDDATKKLLPVIKSRGVVSTTTLKRMHEPVADPIKRMRKRQPCTHTYPSTYTWQASSSS